MRLLLPLLLLVVVLLTLRYAVLSSVRRRQVPARWVPAHLERGGATVVVVRRVAISDGRVLDERVVAKVPVDAPDYDERFLEAMAAARNRAALYRSEDELP
jgi:hypothetical protein